MKGTPSYHALILIVCFSARMCNMHQCVELYTNWLFVKCFIPAAPPYLESKLDCQNKLRRLMEMGFSEVSQATELLCLPSLPCPLATLVVPLAVLNIL